MALRSAATDRPRHRTRSLSPDRKPSAPSRRVWHAASSAIFVYGRPEHPADTRRADIRATKRHRTAMSDRADDASFLNREYDARARTQSFDRERIYKERSQAAFDRIERIADLVYDPASGSKLDIYPSNPGSPLFVWFHGGYWRSSTKDANAFVAPGLVESGVTVASVDYSLAPAVRIGEIVRQVRTSVAWLVRNAHEYGYDAGHVHVGGHSAGGHLVGMLLAEEWQETSACPATQSGADSRSAACSTSRPCRKHPSTSALRLNEARDPARTARSI